ncbi:MAG: transporter [Deferrisomatales bacterium]
MASKSRGIARLLSGAALALLVAAPGTSLADNDARDYIAAPPGTFLMITYYKHIFGHQMFNDGDVVSKDFNLTQNIAIFRPVYYTKVGPFTIDPQCLIIAGEAHADGAGLGGAAFSASGLGDPVLLATLWLVDNPEAKTWLGFTPFLTLPIGSYDKDRALNLGANRWALKPELGFVKGLAPGFFLDLTAAYELYGDNDDFGSASVTKEQDPLLTLEAHLSYDVTKSFYVAADYFYHWGGETTVAGVDQKDEQSNHAWQGTLGFGLANNYQLLIQYRNDFLVQSGAKTDTFGVRFLYAF